MPDNIYISASLLKDYLDCPRKVYYRLNSPELSIQSADMLVGNIVHSALEKHWNDRERAISFVAYEASRNGLQSKYLDKTMLCIHNFFDFYTSLVGENDKIEYRFKVPFGSSFLVGKMDRITESGYVIDWKTSSTPSKSIEKDPQFILYQYVYEQLFNKPPASVMKVSLVDHAITVYSRDRVLEYSIISTVIPVVVDSIRKNTLIPTGLFTGKCSRCPYKVTCHEQLGYKNELDSSTFTDGNSSN